MSSALPENNMNADKTALVLATAQRGIVKVNNATGKVETLDAQDYAALTAAMQVDEKARLGDPRSVDCDDLHRDAHETFASIFVMLTGQGEPWDAMSYDERCARAANEAQEAFRRSE